MLVVFIICLIISISCLIWIRNIFNDDIRKYEENERKKHLEMMKNRKRMSKAELRNDKINDLLL